MLGHKWEPAQGTVIEAQAHHHERRYVIEVRTPTGELIRGNVTVKSGFPHPVGAVIGVEMNSKSGEMRIDPNARTESIRGMMQAAEQMRASAGAAGTAGALGGAASIAALASALGGASGGGAVHVMGPDGQELPVHMNPGDITNLAQAIRSGDPAARQAAVDRLHELRDQARQRAAELQHQAGASPAPGPEGFSSSSGPSTFDEIGTSRHIGAPGTGAFGEPADSFSFGQPAAPSPYQQVSPPMPGSTPTAFGSFNTGAGEGTAEQRIGKLKQLLDKGILTESEYEAQRQQIIRGI
jgi:hypothetical protein